MALVRKNHGQQRGRLLQKLLPCRRQSYGCAGQEELLLSASYMVEISCASSRGSDEPSARHSAFPEATSRIAHATDSRLGTSSDDDGMSSMSTWSSDDLGMRLSAAAVATRHCSMHILGSHLDTSGNVSGPSTSTGRYHKLSAPRSITLEAMSCHIAPITGSDLDTSGVVGRCLRTVHEHQAK